MHRSVLTCAATALVAAALTACSSAPATTDDAGARLRDPSRGVNPDEGARTLIDRRGSGGFATRVDIPSTAEAVRISVTCAPTGSWKADFAGSGGAHGVCDPKTGGSVMLEYGLKGRQDLMLETDPGGRWWLKVESVEHVQTF